MQIENYLKKYQPIIYQTFVNSMRKKTLSHAYLLIGAPGTPLLDTAKFLAKSILCDSPSPLACENCITCLRVESNNYPDFIVLDGSKETIKKDSVSDIETRFEKKAFEKKGIMIYILHLVENMTAEAINSILKFLEEPENEVYAFLTTNNENMVLPTIISRCQKLNLKLVDREKTIKEAIDLGINQDDAELLSYFYNSGELIYDVINSEEKESFYEAKNCINNLLNKLIEEDSRHSIYYFQHRIIPIIKSKESARFFIDILTQIYKEIFNIQNQQPNILQSYDTILTALAEKTSHADKILIELLKQRSALNLNLNIPLVLNHIMNEITKE